MSRRGAFACAALLLSALAAAQAPPRALLEQKETLVRRLLDDAQMRRRAAAGSEEARKQLEAARILHARALEHLAGGEFGQAEASLDQAMRAVGRARRLAPDGLQRAVEERLRYEKLAASIEALRRSYAHHLRRPRDEVLDAVDASLASARELSDAGRAAEATQALAGAQARLLLGLGALLGAEPLRYALEFDSPQAEYRHELERNRSYAALVPFALEELRPAAAGIQLANRYVETSRTLTAFAARQAEQGDWAAALGSVRAGTLYLQRALGAAGLIVPQAIKERE